MLDAALDSDCVEPLDDLFGSADDVYPVLSPDSRFDDGRSAENAFSALAKALEQAAVVELSHEMRTYADRFEPMVQRPANEIVLGRYEERRSLEGLGKATPVLASQIRSREERQTALAQQVIEGSYLDVASDRNIGENEVQALDSELSKQALRLVAVTDYLHRFRKSESGLQEIVTKKLGQNVRDAHTEP